jgi:hypothetical protein
VFHRLSLISGAAALNRFPMDGGFCQVNGAGKSALAKLKPFIPLIQPSRENGWTRWAYRTTLSLMNVLRLVFALTITAMFASAQNSDISILFGTSESKILYDTSAPQLGGPTRRIVSLQAVYARQFYENGKNRLYFEIPFVTSGAVFVTPGMRYQFNLTNRVGIYAFAGAGVAAQQRFVGNDSGWRANFAYDFGGGLDYRLTRLISLRGELRRIRPTPQPTFGNGGAYPAAQFGFAFHF